MKFRLTVLLHDDKELDDDLGRRPDHHLPLPTLLSVVHALESVIQHTDSHHPYLKNNKRYPKGYRVSLLKTITEITGFLEASTNRIVLTFEHFNYFNLAR
jgi:hypothetical protein